MTEIQSPHDVGTWTRRVMKGSVFLAKFPYPEGSGTRKQSMGPKPPESSLLGSGVSAGPIAKTA